MPTRFVLTARLSEAFPQRSPRIQQRLTGRLSKPQYQREPRDGMSVSSLESFQCGNLDDVAVGSALIRRKA